MNDSWTMQVIEAGRAMYELGAQDGLTIGRHPECGLVLKDSHVSARHAKIVDNGAGLAILDLGSNNGTHIDNTVVLREGQEHLLRDHMHIAIGRVEILVLGSPDSTQETMQGDVTAPGDSSEGNATMMADSLAEDSDTQPALDSDSTAEPAPVVTPKPSVEPQVAPPPKEPAPPTPAIHGSDSSFGAFDSVSLNTILGDADSDVGVSAKLARMGARLIVLNEADMRGVEVDAKEFTVGRKPDSSCSLPNRGVSSEHARIVFSPKNNTFILEDLGSGNGTQLNGAPLAPNAPRELHPDAHIRFGTVEAVFVQNMDSELMPVPADRHAFAAKLLASRGHIPPARLKQAKKDAQEQSLSLGEVLLLGRHVNPREWSRAVEDAHVAATITQLGGDQKQTLLWTLLGLLIAGAVLMAIPAGRRLLGFGS